MASIDKYYTKNRQTMWRARIRKGGQNLVAVFPAYFAAKEWAQLTEARLIEQKYLPHRVASHHTFDEAVQRYCAEILRWCAPSTIQKRTQTLKWWNQWWNQRIGRMRLADISPATITEHLQTLTART